MSLGLPYPRDYDDRAQQNALHLIDDLLSIADLWHAAHFETTRLFDGSLLVTFPEEEMQKSPCTPVVIDPYGRIEWA